jgi:hypothetical protein
MYSFGVSETTHHVVGEDVDRKNFFIPAIQIKNEQSIYFEISMIEK